MDGWRNETDTEESSLSQLARAESQKASLLLSNVGCAMDKSFTFQRKKERIIFRNSEFFAASFFLKSKISIFAANGINFSVFFGNDIAFQHLE